MGTLEGSGLTANVSFLGPVPEHECDTAKPAHPPEIAISLAQGPAPQAPTPPRKAPLQKDYFVERSGLRFAGTHLLVDFWQAHNLDDPGLLEQGLREAVDACGATLLHVHLHRFSPNGGVSGVAVLAESHISIHTWPERDYAAVDIFMCGGCDPYRAVPVLRRWLDTDSIQLTEQKRGLLP